MKNTKILQALNFHANWRGGGQGGSDFMVERTRKHDFRRKWTSQ